jgi:hypothetical protein
LTLCCQLNIRWLQKQATKNESVLSAKISHLPIEAAQLVCLPASNDFAHTKPMRRLPTSG